MPMRNAEYLGDGVYASTDGYHVIIAVSNGVYFSEPIYLEPSVLERLNEYAQKLKEAQNGPQGS